MDDIARAIAQRNARDIAQRNAREIAQRNARENENARNHEYLVHPLPRRFDELPHELQCEALFSAFWTWIMGTLDSTAFLNFCHLWLNQTWRGDFLSFSVLEIEQRACDYKFDIGSVYQPL